MANEIKAPAFPESVPDGVVVTWHKQTGDQVARDELLVEIETDKVVLEVVAPTDGVLGTIVKAEGATVLSNELLATVLPNESAVAEPPLNDKSSEPTATSSTDAVKQDINAPSFPESVPDGTIASWHKASGQAVSRDELLVEIETDKVMMEVTASTDGVMGDIIKVEGDTVTSGEMLGSIVLSNASAVPAASTAIDQSPSKQQPVATSSAIASPSARKLAAEKAVDLSTVTGTGKRGLVSKDDVKKAVSASAATPLPTAAPSSPSEDTTSVSVGDRIEKRVPMTRLRKRIAERLMEATTTTAMLTTFNEVDMGPVMALRNKYKDLFEKVNEGTRLGFMGFFVKASVAALEKFPAINASLDGNDVVYHGYQDIGVAVSTPGGLVVPVLRNAESMGLATIESTIRDFGLRARDGKLGIDEMTGGTFTVTNGGVFGSLLSTPILNLPQTAILGMHKIQERPVAVNGKVEIRPMMYLALSYDHRMVDGKDAVQFLVTIKELLEDPARFLLAV